MSHFVFLPLPETGHVLPTLRLAQSLEARGHQVTYAVPPYLAPSFDVHGFDCRGLFSDVFADRNCDDPLWNYPENIFRDRIREHLLRSRIGFTDFLVSELHDFEFDVLICDHVLMTYLSAALPEELRKPVVVLRTNLPEQDAHDPDLPTIVLCPYELEIPGRARLAARPNVVYAQPSVYRNRKDKAFCWNRLLTGSRLVYCSFGTQSAQHRLVLEVVEEVIETFRGLPECQLVLNANRSIDRGMSPLAENVLLVSKVPQLEMLACSDLFISHGGLGGIKESILAGVPMIIVPFEHDQPSNARRIAFHELGCTSAPQGCNASHFKDLVTTTLNNERILRNVKQMQNVFWKHELRASAVDSLESIASQSRFATVQ